MLPRKLLRRYLLACRHFDTSSVRLFKDVDLFAVMILNFSVKHRLHLFDALLYDWARSLMRHFKLKGWFLFFKSHTYFESSVLLRYLSFLSDDM